MLNITVPIPGRFPVPPRPTGAKPVHVWGIPVRLQVGRRLRDLALFDLALDSKLRGCELTALRVSDLVSGGCVKGRAIILQRKTGRPVQFEVTEQTRRSIANWIDAKELGSDDLLFPSRSKKGSHLSTRQYARLVDTWVTPSSGSIPAPRLRGCAHYGRAESQRSNPARDGQGA